MKTKLLFLVMLSIFGLSVNAQTNVSVGKTWTKTNNPFQTDVFVENYGQFNNWVQTSETIKYALINSDKVFFTQHGLIYRVEKIEAINKTSREENENETDKDENIPTLDKYYVQMNWVGSNPNCIIEVSDKTEGYYTFGERGYENIKANGYKKIVYKNLYSQIDVEYTIPRKGGIEYRLILHPGADISQVKMQYAGDILNSKIDDEGNIVINTLAGAITDHAPQSYYEENKTKIQSSFELNNKVVSFKFNEFQISDNTLKTAIIDPWTTTPTSLTTDSAAYDIAYTDYGEFGQNVYVSGGNYPFKLAKYSPSGTLLWTFTNPSSFDSTAITYSKFCIIPTSGTAFIGEGWENTGPKVMKINSGGSLVYTTPNLLHDQEIWKMYYSRCTDKLYGFGGGTMTKYNVQVLSDTNLTSSAARDFNGYNSSDNDIAETVEDVNGDFYALMSSQVAFDNYLIKSQHSTHYAVPPAWAVNSNYNYYECANSGIPGFASDCTGPQTVRANALALNYNYLFSYDGETIKAWNKLNGASLGSKIVNAGYAGGQYRTHEGLAVDDCNNVYVGGNSKIHVFYFNGSAFTTEDSITTNIPNEVYDVSLDRLSGTLYICGLGFITVTSATEVCTPLASCDSSLNILNISSNLADFLIFPNPANNNLTIEAEDLRFKNSDLRICDIVGNTVLEKTLYNKVSNIDVSVLAKGMYFVEIKTEKGVAVKKFVKQ